MFRSDAKAQPIDNLFNNIQSISVDVILEIQKDVDPYDMVSLVFLLYDVPDTALQRLIIYQRVSKDVKNNNMNLLYDWALNAQSRPTWRYEFLEALTVCRLFNVIRKLGFNVTSVKKHYLPENLHVNIYIDPMKKVLYKLCESITSEYFLKLQKSLTTFKNFKINVLEHETPEVIILELICQKFIKLGQYNHESKMYTSTYDIENLATIIENFTEFTNFANILREVQIQVNSQNRFHETDASTPITTHSLSNLKSKGKAHNVEFDETFQLINQLDDEDITIENLKSDTKIIPKDAYVLKNKNRIGVCCIINQEVFYPSEESIKLKETELETRLGSTKDLYCLERTMSALKFVVKSKSNLDHKETIKFIKDVLRNEVKPEDSVFMLCILSHGVRGHVYAADSIKIKVEHIQNILDADDASHLHGVPKVLILQACQVDLNPEINKKIVSDAPRSNFYLRKSHFLIYWATAPEYEAYRLEDKGSIFIQCLCGVLIERVKNEHLSDIFTKVTARVTCVSNIIKRAQVPIFESTLQKKLYLQIPEYDQNKSSN